MADDAKPDPNDLSGAKFIVNVELRERIFALHLSGLTWEEACEACFAPPMSDVIAAMLRGRFPDL